MFKFFRAIHVCNLGVVAALNSGGLIDEVDRACRPDPGGGREGFRRRRRVTSCAAWTALTDQLVGQLAEQDEKRGAVAQRRAKLSPCHPLRPVAERLQSRCWRSRPEPRTQRTRRPLSISAPRSPSTRQPPGSVVWIEIPTRDTTLPAYFVRPTATTGPAPVHRCMFNGLDCTETMLPAGSARAGRPWHLRPDGRRPRRRRALRLQGFTAVVDSEAWATASRRAGVRRRPTPIASSAGPLGGYYAPRAAAFEKRLALVVGLGRQPQLGGRPARRYGEGQGRALLGTRPVVWDS